MGLESPSLLVLTLTFKVVIFDCKFSISSNFDAIEASFVAIGSGVIMKMKCLGFVKIKFFGFVN